MRTPKGTRYGGRQKGTKNKATAATAAAIAESGLTPLDYMLSILRNVGLTLDTRLEAAKCAAPYVHPKLASMELKGVAGKPLEINIVRFSDKPPQ